MRKSVIAILSVVALLFSIHYASAATLYDEYKKEIADNEKQIEKYEKENAELQAYLDAVDSGDPDLWEAARKKSAVMSAIRIFDDKTEVEAVQAQLDLNKSLISYDKIDIEIAQHKMDIYFNAFIRQDMDAVNAILANGNRTLPADISGNVYCAWPYTEIPEGMLTDKEVLFQNCGNVYLAPVTVTGIAYRDVYLVDIDGIQAEVDFNDNTVSIGETINLYFTPAGMETADLSYLVIAEREKSIDTYHHLRTRKD